MTKESKPQLKLVQKGEYRFPSYFTNEMKKFGRKLIGELVEAKMLAVCDLPLVFNYVMDQYLLDELNKKIMKCDSSSEIKRLQSSRNSISADMLRLANALGLNVKSRSGGFSEVLERTDKNESDINFPIDLDYETLDLMEQFYEEYPDSDYNDFQRWRNGAWK